MNSKSRDPPSSWFASSDDDYEEDGDVLTMASSNVNSSFWQQGADGAAGAASFPTTPSSDNPFRQQQQQQRIEIIKQHPVSSVPSPEDGYPVSVSDGGDVFTVPEDGYPSSVSDGGDIFTVDFDSNLDPENGAGNEIDYENETTHENEVEKQQRDYEDVSDPPAERLSTTGSSGDIYTLADLKQATNMAEGEGESIILERSFDGSTIATRPTAEGPSFISSYGHAANQRDARDPESQPGGRSYDVSTLSSSRPTGGGPSFISYYASENSNNTNEGGNSGGTGTTGAAKKKASFCTPKTLAVFGILLMLIAAIMLITVSTTVKGSFFGDDEDMFPDAITPTPTVVPTTTSPTNAPSQSRDVAPTDPPSTSAPTQTPQTPEPTPKATPSPTTSAPTDPPETPEPTPEPTQVPTIAPTDPPQTPEPTPEATQAPTKVAPTTRSPTFLRTPEPTREATPTPATVAPTTPAATDVPTQTETLRPTPGTTNGPDPTSDPRVGTCGTCGDDDDCRSNVCIDGFCATANGLRCNDAPCDDNVQCISGRCDPRAPLEFWDQTCQDKLPNGSTCTHRTDCMSDRCVLFFCIP